MIYDSRVTHGYCVMLVDVLHDARVMNDVCVVTYDSWAMCEACCDIVLGIQILPPI